MYGSWENSNIIEPNDNNQSTNGLSMYPGLKINMLGKYGTSYDYIGNYYTYKLAGFYASQCSRV